MSRHLEHGTDAYARGAWQVAHRALTAARRAGPLGGEDLERLALASYLTGREEDFLEALSEAHQSHLDEGAPLPAVRCAFWLGLHLANRNEIARASGWFGRAARLLEQDGRDCAERGYMLLPTGQRQLIEGRYEQAAESFGEAVDIAQRFDDPDLSALALHLQGRAWLRLGRAQEGLALLDEAMVAVTTDALSPVSTGLIYCSVIGACREVYALHRAQEWTGALAAWCERQPEMVAYTGECRIFQAEVLQRKGEWHLALDEIDRALERLSSGVGMAGAAGLAHYRQAEGHRLLGRFEEAEEAYRAASRAGRQPQPGLALLRLAQEDGAAASASIRRALAETPDRHRRVHLLPAHIEIMLAVGELDEARRSLHELTEMAEGCADKMAKTVVAYARGAVELASGHPEEALAPLREAWREWQALAAPYDAARARVLLGLACRALGDEDGARLELEAAREAFERLGAAPDVERLDRHGASSPPPNAHGLTPREREVLALVATGRTNRAVGKALFISEKTVARHVANIFNKLGVSSRAAATAFAYEHDLLDGST